MSGLSLADMRRIGAQRNADVAQQKPIKKSLFGSLPFFGKREAAAPVDRVTRKPLEPVTSVATSQKPTLSSAQGLTDAVALRPLKQSVLRHVGAGGAIGAVLGFGATGDPIALPAAALVGAIAGNMIAKRAQAIPSDSVKSMPLQCKDAPRLFEVLERACKLAGLDGNALKVFVDQSTCVSAATVPSSRLASSKGHTIHIGLAVLTGLSLQQIEALVAHALVQAKYAHDLNAVSAQTTARLGALESSLSARSAMLRLANLDAWGETARWVSASWQDALNTQVREADELTARYSGPRVLVEALLSQALLAALFLRDANHGTAYGNSLATLKAGYPKPKLDYALRLLAKTPRPSPAEVLTGLPMSLLDRLDALDTSCPVPSLPARNVAVADLPDLTVQRLEKRLAELSKVSKPQKAAKAKGNDAKTSKPPKAPKAVRSSGLLGGLFGRNRRSQANLQTVDLSEQPLYHADTLFKHDPGSGLEAYQALVDTHPRWALARLRLAEAQLESGIADCVPNLMACAELLPSALPSVLDRLQSALAMVSPLEEEPLRQAVDELLINADAIAQERSEIELDGLAAPTLDAQDLEMLKTLFANKHGLREAWVFAAPCAWMPEVPHHAILGLAPRIAPEDAQAIAVALAEHAAVSGTVAVHIETGTPHGALGDALASRPSLWRVGHR